MKQHLIGTIEEMVYKAAERGDENAVAMLHRMHRDASGLPDYLDHTATPGIAKGLGGSYDSAAAVQRAQAPNEEDAEGDDIGEKSEPFRDSQEEGERRPYQPPFGQVTTEETRPVGGFTPAA